MPDTEPEQPAPAAVPSSETPPAAAPQREIGGRPGLDPTRYGDWESKGIASDF